MRHIPQSTVRRLSIYLRVLEDLEPRGDLTISSRDLAERAVYGDNEYYFTIWSQVEPQDQRSQ